MLFDNANIMIFFICINIIALSKLSIIEFSISYNKKVKIPLKILYCLSFSEFIVFRDLYSFLLY